MKIYKGDFTIVAMQGDYSTLFTITGEPYYSAPTTTEPTIEHVDINSLDKSVAGNILKTMFWRLTR